MTNKQMNVRQLSDNETVEEIPTVEELRAYYRSEGGLYDLIVGDKARVEQIYTLKPELRGGVEQMMEFLDNTLPYIELALRKGRATSVHPRTMGAGVDTLIGLAIATYIRMTNEDTMKYADAYLVHERVLNASMPSMLSKFAQEDFALRYMTETGGTRAQADTAHIKAVKVAIDEHERKMKQEADDPISKPMAALGGKAQTIRF